MIDECAKMSFHLLQLGLKHDISYCSIQYVMIPFLTFDSACLDVLKKY